MGKKAKNNETRATSSSIYSKKTNKTLYPFVRSEGTSLVETHNKRDAVAKSREAGENAHPTFHRKFCRHHKRAAPLAPPPGALFANLHSRSGSRLTWPCGTPAVVLCVAASAIWVWRGLFSPSTDVLRKPLRCFLRTLSEGTWWWWWCWW